MTILFAGQEDISFGTVNGSIMSSLTDNSWAVDTNSNGFRAGYARYALTYQTAGNVTQIAFIYNKQLFSSSSFWITGRCSIRNGGSASTSSTLIPMQWGNGDSPKLRLRFNGTGSVPASFFVVEKISAAGVVTQLGSTSTDGFSWVAGNVNWQQDKIDVFINYSGSGQITVYRNGRIIFTYSGDVTVDGLTTLTTAYWGTIYTTTGNGTGTSWSEMIISTTDTRNFSLVTQAPTTFISQNGINNGLTLAWSGAFIHYTKVVANYTGTLSSTTMYLQSGNAAGTYRFGVYSDVNGLPSSLLGSGSSVNPPVGLLTVSMSGSVSITVGTIYWVAMVTNASGPVWYMQTPLSGPVIGRVESGIVLPATATPVITTGGVFEWYLWASFTVISVPGTTLNFATSNIVAATTNFANTTVASETSNVTGQIQEYPVTPYLTSISQGVNSLTTYFYSQNTNAQSKVLAVVQHALAGIGPTGLQNMQFVINVNNVNYYSSTIALGTGKDLVSNIWSTNPSTSNTWTASNLTSLSNTFYSGYKSIT